MTTSEIRESGTVTASPPILAPTGYHTTPRDDLITAICGMLLVAGVAVDAWAHTNILETIESFFTPWHAMLYGGFATIAAWTYWLAFRERARYPTWWRNGWPAGYLVGGIGVALFLLAGLMDMVWHTVFGIEVSLEATYSPSHLLIALSGVLLLTSPLRSWWASDSERGLRAAAGMISAGLGATMTMVLLLTLSVFFSTPPTVAYAPDNDSVPHLRAVIAFGGYLVTTLVCLVPLMLIYRRRLTLGAAPTIFGLVALFAVVTQNFEGPQLEAAIGAVLGAAAAEAVLVRLDAVRGTNATLRLPIAGASVALFTWAGYLLGAQLGTGIVWPPDLWVGVMVLTTLLGAALGGLAAPPSSHKS
jgi:hypothetical protein